MSESARATALHALKDAKKVRCRNTRYGTRPDYWENIRLEDVLDLATVALRPVLLFAGDPLQSHGFKRIVVLRYLVSQLPLPAVCRVNALTHELTGFVAGTTRALYGHMASTFVGIVFADRENVFLAVYPIAVAPQLRATRPHLQIQASTVGQFDRFGLALCAFTFVSSIGGERFVFSIPASIPAFCAAANDFGRTNAISKVVETLDLKVFLVASEQMRTDANANYDPRSEAALTRSPFRTPDFRTASRRDVYYRFGRGASALPATQVRLSRLSRLNPVRFAGFRTRK